MSDHDYPTDDELKRLREWPLNDPRGWLEEAQSLWWSADWGWPEPVADGVDIHASTGGWSGNESIIDAMQDSILWSLVWKNTRRGGHYTFKLPGPEYYRVAARGEEE